MSSSSSAHPTRTRSLPSSSSSVSLTSHASHSSAHPRERQHSYSSYPSTPLASFFPEMPSPFASFLPEIAPEEAKQERRVRSATTGEGIDAFGMMGFVESGQGGGWGWIGAGEDESESDEDEEEEEEDGGEQRQGGWRDSWAGAGGPTSPVLETHFGFSEDDGDGEKGEGVFGFAVKEVEVSPDEDEDGLGPLSKTSSSSFLAFLPSPTGSFQHVEHEDTLLRTYSSTNLDGLIALSAEDEKGARVLNHGGVVGGGGGGWRGWIGV